MREYSGFFMRELTPKQEKFAQCVADGMNQSEAYRAAFNVAPTTKPESVTVRASELMANSKVRGRVIELQAKLAEIALWTREDSVNVLKSIATDEFNAKPAERVSAVKELNAMHGFNAPQVIDHKSSDGSHGRAITIGADTTPEVLDALAAKLGLSDDSYIK